MQLIELRNQIDQIDDQLRKLFTQRMELCAKIAEYKQQNEIAVLDSSRENEMLNKISELYDEDMVPHVKALYKSIFEISRSYQSKILADERKNITGDK